jgi:hypothetical protein
MQGEAIRVDPRCADAYKDRPPAISSTEITGRPSRTTTRPSASIHNTLRPTANGAMYSVTFGRYQQAIVDYNEAILLDHQNAGGYYL